MSYLISSIFRPSEIIALIHYKYFRSTHLLQIDPENKPKKRCYEFLRQTSRSFAAVIQEVHEDLRDGICIFYLILRGMDTIEDDMTIPIEKKEPLLRNFHNLIFKKGWTYTESGPNEKDRQLLLEFDVVIDEFLCLKKEFRDIIADTTKKMGNGMADYAKDTVRNKYGIMTIKDFDTYCYYVAGLVGIGLTGLFATSGLEDPEFDNNIELANSMGLFLQKVNITRDYLVDDQDGRKFWPKEIWSKYTNDLSELKKPENATNALNCLSDIILNALQHVPDCLTYMSRLKEQTVFNFCAIPQVMAIATLSICFRNHDVFKKVVKLRRGESVKLILRSKNIYEVADIFRYYNRVIINKNDPRDPNYLKISMACGQIEQWCTANLPDINNYQSSTSKHPNNTKASFTDLTKEQQVAPLLSSDASEIVEDSYIVVFKNQLDDEKIKYHHNCVRSLVKEENKKLAKRGFLDKLISGLKHTYNFKNLKGYSGRFSPDVLEKIRRSEEVAWVEKDQVVYTTELQRNAPWGLARISHRSGLVLRNFNKYLYDSDGGEGVTIYIIDTGININHTDFEGRATWGRTIPENDQDIDGNGHGTHVAGTVAGKKYGVAKKADVVAIKVLRSNGSGTMADVIKGVEFAAESHQEAEQKAKRAGKPFKGSGANMSLGGGKSRTLDNAVNGAVRVGLNFAVAAGNDNRDACDFSPAAAELAITVGASTVEDERAWFSNHGVCVDIFAPGKDITSAWIGSRYATNTISGTSMASPHVAGLIAYLISLEPDTDSEYYTGSLTPKELKNKMIKLATTDILTGIPKNTPNLLAFNGYEE
ncbi:2280_t:CDS:10 [Diversispora eburnea]|uniref:squalene synthase n=1 Tax=Diversispora eburnea TaxID=1213867 RepID=A0A9N9B410_9GLOM|nr:2280_t:CDS:10 [Diversispora eburnea]